MFELDLRAVEAHMEWPNGAPRDELTALIAHCRALRAALQEMLREAPYHNEEALTEYWEDVRERAAAVLAQAKDGGA